MIKNIDKDDKYNLYKLYNELKDENDVDYLDYLFYSLTIQSGVGLPDVTALSDLAKILAMVQQLIVMGSAYILINIFYLK